MSLCAHLIYDPYCARCNTGIVDCACGGKPSCSQCGGKGYYIGGGASQYRKLEELLEAEAIGIGMQRGGKCELYEQRIDKSRRNAREL